MLQKTTSMQDSELLKKAIELLGAKNITEAIRMALEEAVAKREIMKLDQLSLKDPLEFKYTAEEIREINRQTP